MAVGYFPAFSQPIGDSLRDTASVIKHALDSGSFEVKHTQAAPDSTRTRVFDSAAASRPSADSGAARNPAPVLYAAKPAHPSPAGISMPGARFIVPEFALDYFITPDNQLPPGKIFLLAGKELFIAKKRLSDRFDVGISGGTAFRSSLKYPQGFIFDEQNMAQQAMENGRGISVSCGSYSVAARSIFDEGPSFDDGCQYTWIGTSSAIDFEGPELRSLQGYVNAHLAIGDLSLMAKPLAFGQHIVHKSVLYRSTYDPAHKSLSFSKEGEVSTDFPVRNFGLIVDPALIRRVNRSHSVYARCPVEYRKITSAATRSILAQFNVYPDDDGDYTRFVKLDTFDIPAYDGYYLDVSPCLGVNLESPARLVWPFVFAPFIAQKVNFEGYYSASRYNDSDTRNPQRPWIEKFGCRFTSFQNIRLGNRMVTGMENLLRAKVDGTYDGSYRYNVGLQTEYVPQVIIHDRFFVSGPRLSVKYDRSGLNLDTYNRLGLGYSDTSWGFSFTMDVKKPVNHENYQDAVNVVFWRDWK